MNKLYDEPFKVGCKLGLTIFLFAQIIPFLIISIWLIILRALAAPGISLCVFWDIGFPFTMYYGMYVFFHGNVDFEVL